ncbi:Benzaldehyde dehydrogenase [NAD(+)] [Paraburkholderia ultramafica]|uniref:Benzaldehyde dehydrogenase [NAD(+)] n=1 Tax=Paraburkholderia ultramafica TaxID=1544867 RepID=A0A6S7BRZ6_9BURK|nr:aldehyde dehydrogenase family protein [Paraburkholderia ultramafica]CAB3800498.1 Benzaldehyde dehydrogenase [NAD(+)] [Paraburkholderia ultramafica]
MQTGWHLVRRSLANVYALKLAERAQKLLVGNPYKEHVHFGPLTNQKQRNRIDDIVMKTLASGATLVAGGRFEKLFYQPTILTHVTADMPAFMEDIFGLVAPVTVFADDVEAVALVNASDCGLAAAVHTRSLSRGFALSSQIRAEMVHLNDQMVNNEFHVPVGGMGSAGNGGPANVHEFTQTQWISALDKPMAYPFSTMEYSKPWPVCDRLRPRTSVTIGKASSISPLRRNRMT